MPDYLLLLREEPSVFEHVSPEEMQATYAKTFKARLLYVKL